MPPLLISAAVVFLEGLSFGVILPVLSAFADKLGGNESVAGLLFALSTAPRILFAPLWGRLSEQWGRKGTLAVVTAGTFSASMLWALSQSLGAVLWGGLTWLLISRTVYGVFAAQSVLGLAVASDVSGPEKRSAAMGALGAAFGLAFTIGPWIGGTFAQHFGEGEIGLLAGAFQLTSIAIILLLLRETAPLKSDQNKRNTDLPARPVSLARIAAVPAVAWMLGVCLLTTIAYSVLFPTFQPLAEKWYGWTLSRAGLALSVFGLIGAIVQGGMIRPAVRRLGERTTAGMGLILLGAGLLGVAAHPGEAGFWCALALAALGTGFAVPSVLGMMSLAVDSHAQGGVHGLNQSATSMGRACGYLLGGGVYAAFGPPPAYAIAAALALAAIFLLVLAHPLSHGGTPHPQQPRPR